MKQVLYVFIVLVIVMSGCRTASIQGVYVCDASQKQKDTTIRHQTYDEIFTDMTCIISKIDFKGNSSVLLTIQNAQIGSSYVIDGDYIRIKSDKGDMLFKRINKVTLKAEGFPEGTFHKSLD